jgi:Ca2+-binding EF-hand superfamily protein
MNKVNTGFTGPITADFNGNGTVDFPDFISFAQQFGKTPADIGFDALFDLNNSGSVDFGDFISFAQQFGLKT